PEIQDRARGLGRFAGAAASACARLAHRASERFGSARAGRAARSYARNLRRFGLRSARSARSVRGLRAMNRQDPPKPNRFYKAAEAAAHEGGWTVRLDGRVLKSPA